MHYESIFASPAPRKVATTDSAVHAPTDAHRAREQGRRVMPFNAFILGQHIPDAHLVMYPDASHGAQSQYAEEFLEHARRFLNGAYDATLVVS
jgi:pimeloyl-ACP methyl ester carboxylesterase